ncbi:MAG: hotdog fold thioesterase [Bdellovibrionales bacterium]|nr:hotdog fold thioesterase [Bdellovibrionales bacterium]
MIWHKEYSIEEVQAWGHRNLAQHVGIEFTAIDAESLSAKMPVDHRTQQPFGILHGGASCVLAETVGSVASGCVLNPQTQTAVGLEINANHVRSQSEGWVFAVATPLHLGRSTHIWNIRIENDQGKLVCISRLTMAVLEREKR